MKRFLSLLLVLALVLSFTPAMPIQVQASTEKDMFFENNAALLGNEQDNNCGENVIYTLSNGVLTISGSGLMTDYTSTSAVPWQSQRESIVEIIVEDGVTSIGDRAFYNCNALRKVTIGESVTTIGAYAFYGCVELAEITFPASVTTIKEASFRSCRILSDITFWGDAPLVGNYAFADGETEIELHYYEGSIGFSDVAWNSFTHTTIHVGDWVVDVESTCDYEGSRHMTCSVCGEYLSEKIPLAHNFKNDICTLCGKTRVIASGSTWALDALETLTIIGSGRMPNYNKEKAPWYSYRDQIKMVVIEDGITTIGEHTFSNCTYLTSITIPDSVTSIGSSAFEYCSSLTSITIPDSVTTIGQFAFSHCSSLTSITIPDSVTTIGSCAFIYCSGLTSVSLPNSLRRIDFSLFKECSSLVMVTIPESVTWIGSDAFYNCKKLTNITIPNGVTFIGDSAFYGCSRLTSITIPDGVTSIESGTFSGSGLTSVTIGNGVTSIGPNAFSWCNLTNIILPDSVTRIWGNAFYQCEKLRLVTIPESLTRIDSCAFLNCYNLSHVAFAGTQSQWDNIVGDGKTRLTEAILHYQMVFQNVDNCVESGVYCPACNKLILRTLKEGSAHSYENSLDRSCQNCDFVRVVTAISVAEAPEKLGYTIFEDTLDITGGELLLTYDDGDSGTIPMTLDMVSGFDNTVIGVQTLTVTYEGKTATFTVEICATVPDSVEIHTLPTKCYYFTGETLDLTGLALKAHYGEKVAIITAFDDVAEVDMTTAGIKEVSVVFQGIETVFSIYVHEGKTDVVTVDSSLYPESNHNYSNNLNETKTFTYPGALSLTITFNSQTSVESNYDYIYIYDCNDTQIAKYTGTTAAGKTLTIPGDSFKVKLTSDGSQVKYGYAFSSIKATAKKGTIHPAAIDPATATCTQAGLTEGSHCEICGMVLVAQEEVPALGHNYEAAFSWNEDHSACTYVLTCSRCADVQTLPCSVAVADVTQQQTTHCATVAYGGQEYNDTFICDHALITFENWDGTQLSSVYYHVGEEITVPSNPTKAADNTYTYTFAGWDKEVVDCAGDATYTATYTSNYIDYTVVFKNWSGDVISTKIYHYGEKVEDPADPTKAADKTYTYTFAGWDKEVVDCVGDATYTATYTSDYIDYTVVFKNWNGDVLSTKTYHYGEKVTAPADPTKAADKMYTYTFAGWDKDVVDCAGDATYTATYTSNYIDYTVMFKNWNGDVISTKTYHYGDTAEVPANPTREANNTYTYDFIGWDKTVSKVTGDAVYTATYAPVYISYTVIFQNHDGTVLSKQFCHYGDSVVAPGNPTRYTDETYTYAFSGWDSEVTKCDGDKVYTATYMPTYRDYIITFINYDGSVISEKTYHYGDTVTPPADPTRESSNTYKYTFSGWNNTVTACTGSKTYTAVYTPEYIDYTITFKNYDGTVIDSKVYHYGDYVVAPTPTGKPADNKYTYDFAGWDSSVVPCNGNKEYVATYTPQYINYSVTFQYEDGTVIKQYTLHYGESVAVPAAPAVPEAFGDNYEFSGWDKEVTDCQGNAVYTAVFARKYISGDLTGDDKINSLDGLLLMRYLNGWNVTIASPEAMDVNGDGKVNSLDGLILMRYLNGWNVTLG